MNFKQQLMIILQKGMIDDWCWDGDDEIQVSSFNSQIALEQLIEFLKKDNNFEQLKQLVNENKS